MKNKQKVCPGKQHLEWADCEIGVIIHLEPPVFEPSYNFRKNWDYLPSPEMFNPAELDTDQWLKTASTAGAKYAVLVAKGCSGFTLWPTKEHEYGIHSSPWRQGKGDIVADFIKSCKKYDIKPGLYYSASCNAVYKVDNPGRPVPDSKITQSEYNKIVIAQLTELWGDYGDIFEIWFDGGVIAPEEGGPEIVKLLNELQPEAVVFQGPPQCGAPLRWSGNEGGIAPDPCWSTADFITDDGGIIERSDCGGNPDGAIWAPAEADIPNRTKQSFSRGWLWHEGEDHFLVPVSELVNAYCKSVGRNTNLLIGMPIDSRGLVPEADCQQFYEFGKITKEMFSDLISEASGSGLEFVLEIPENKAVSRIVIMENQEEGQKIRDWKLEGLSGTNWNEISKGTCIGHKRIINFECPLELNEVKIVFESPVGKPEIRKFAAYA